MTTNAFDTEITDLALASFTDMAQAGITNADQTDPMILRAMITFCRLNFGQPDDYDRLKKSYDEQKAQMSMATGYTNWG